MNRYKSFLIITILSVLISPIMSAGRRVATIKPATEDPKLTLMKQYTRNGNFCLSTDDYVQTYKNQLAAREYITSYCNKNVSGDIKTHLRSHYGSLVNNSYKQGSFGKVYTYQNSNGDKFAIKVPKNFNYSEAMTEIHTNECLKANTPEDSKRILADMATFIECVWPAGSSPHLVMKYYPNDLTTFLRKNYSMGWNRFSYDQKIEMLNDMKKIVIQLMLIHSLKIAHRDIKTDNIMVSSDGTPGIADFGTGTPNGEYSQTVAGTPYYLDPDLLNGKSVGIEADIYSLGITLVQMATFNTFKAKIDNMLIKGNYNVKFKVYKPDPNLLGIPSELSWLKLMLTSYKNRLSLKDALKKIQETAEALIAQKNAQSESRKELIKDENLIKRSVSALEKNPKNEPKKFVVDSENKYLRKNEEPRPIDLSPQVMNNRAQQKEHKVIIGKNEELLAKQQAILPKGMNDDLKNLLQKQGLLEKRPSFLNKQAEPSRFVIKTESRPVEPQEVVSNQAKEQRIVQLQNEIDQHRAHINQLAKQKMEQDASNKVAQMKRDQNQQAQKVFGQQVIASSDRKFANPFFNKDIVIDQQPMILAANDPVLNNNVYNRPKKYNVAARIVDNSTQFRKRQVNKAKPNSGGYDHMAELKIRLDKIANRKNKYQYKKMI